MTPAIRCVRRRREFSVTAETSLVTSHSASELKTSSAMNATMSSPVESTDGDGCTNAAVTKLSRWLRGAAAPRSDAATGLAAGQPRAARVAARVRCLPAPFAGFVGLCRLRRAGLVGGDGDCGCDSPAGGDGAGRGAAEAATRCGRWSLPPPLPPGSNTPGRRRDAGGGPVVRRRRHASSVSVGCTRARPARGAARA